MQRKRLTGSTPWVHLARPARRAWETLNSIPPTSLQTRWGLNRRPNHLATSAAYCQQRRRLPPNRLPAMIDAQSFSLDTWLPMTSYPGEAVVTSNPLYSDLQMGGMDQFGFFTPPQQDQAFFPSASEIRNLAVQHQRQPQQQQDQDQDQEMWQPAADRGAYFGFYRGSYQR